MKGITLCADCAYYNMKKHKCTRGFKIDPDVSKGENPSFYVDCPLPDVEPLQKWIPCSERLPDSDERCLVFTKGHNVGISRMMGRNLRGEWTCCGYEVTHWMPLPEPPKEG